MGLSRSRFFATAISEFLQSKKEEEMLEALNQVYSEGISHEEKRVLKGIKAKMRKIAEPE
jgi:hypothetical protein